MRHLPACAPELEFRRRYDYELKMAWTEAREVWSCAPECPVRSDPWPPDLTHNHPVPEELRAEIRRRQEEAQSDG